MCGDNCNTTNFGNMKDELVNKNMFDRSSGSNVHVNLRLSVVQGLAGTMIADFTKSLNAKKDLLLQGRIWTLLLKSKKKYGIVINSTYYKARHPKYDSM